MFNILEKIYMNLMCIDLFSKNNFYIKWFLKYINEKLRTSFNCSLNLKNKYSLFTFE